MEVTGTAKTTETYGDCASSKESKFSFDCSASNEALRARINDGGLARRLIARAYLNTYLVSLFLAPSTNGEIDRLAKLPERLDKIVAG